MHHSGKFAVLRDQSKCMYLKEPTYFLELLALNGNDRLSAM